MWQKKLYPPTCATQPSLPFFAVPVAKDYVDGRDHWVYMFFLLMVYKDREGSVDVPFRHVENGWQLGAWLADQRNFYRRNILNPTHQERLEAAGVAWNLHHRNWDKMLGLLAEFKAREGHARVPQKHQEQGKHLGEWLNLQRTNQKNGLLSAERQKQLEDQGVSWDAQEAKWDIMCALLVKYKLREDNVEVPLNYREGGEKLGTWLASQRKFLKQGALSSERHERLEELGVNGTNVYSTTWDRMVQLLADFIEREGHANVPKGHQEQGEDLGVWLGSRRWEKKQGRLSAERQQQLENMGIIWNTHAAKWDKMYSLLLDFQKREGHVIVPQKHVEGGEQLGMWLTQQRQAIKRETLPLDRHQRLEDLGIATRRTWDEMVELLTEFADREGHINVLHGHQERGENLGFWLVTQRMNKKQGKLSSKRQLQLEGLGIAWDAHAAKWERMFAHLEDFHNREGHVVVPQKHEEDGEPLGVWLTKQRQAIRRGTLSTHRHERLQDLGVAPRKGWDETVALLAKFKEREGHINLRRDHQEQGINLGEWLKMQRVYKKQGLLSSERQQQLEDLGVCWDAQAAKWEKMFALLVDFQKKEGHVNVPQSYKVDGENLGTWLGSTQRQAMKKGSLSADRYQRLTELGVVPPAIKKK